jgi:branched-chain amino acid transport system permease protein
LLITLFSYIGISSLVAIGLVLMTGVGGSLGVRQAALSASAPYHAVSLQLACRHG